jgi:hypothetical protein
MTNLIPRIEAACWLTDKTVASFPASRVFENSGTYTKRLRTAGRCSGCHPFPRRRDGDVGIGLSFIGS